MAKILLDFDGTLWKRGAWLPGAVEAVREMIDAGHHVTIFSLRLNRTSWGREKTPGEFMGDLGALRREFDEAGLPEVDLWTQDKPDFDLYICDRVMRHPGRPGSWKRMLPAIKARLEGL